MKKNNDYYQLKRVAAGIKASEISFGYFLRVILAPYAKSSKRTMTIFQQINDKYVEGEIILDDRFLKEEVFEIFNAIDFCIKKAEKDGNLEQQFLLEEYKKYNFSLVLLYKKYPKYYQNITLGKNKEKVNRILNILLNYLYVIPLFPIFVIWCAITEITVNFIFFAFRGIKDYINLFFRSINNGFKEFSLLGNFIYLPISLVLVLVVYPPYLVILGIFYSIKNIFIRIIGFLALQHLESPREVLIGTIFTLDELVSS